MHDAPPQPWLLEVQADTTHKSTLQQWQEYQETAERVGGLISPALAAKLLNVSRARVGQLTDEKKLAVWNFLDHPWVSAVEVVHRIGNPLPVGRPKKTA
jgi:hypothetical protein